MARRGGLVGRAISRLEEYTGYSVVDSEHLRVQEAVAREAFRMSDELEELGYVSMNFVAGRPTEPTATTRRRWAQQARVVWLADPLAGAAVEMRNEFTFGRGVPKPRAKAKPVQEVIDAFWDDPQNQRVLTSFDAQMRFGSSLAVQSNVWFLMFDDGDDGAVKLSFLNHDSVSGAYADPENRQRVLFYLAADVRNEWDFNTHAVKATATKQPVVRYYEVWEALQDALVERGMDEDRATRLLEQYRAAGQRARDKEPDEAGEFEIARAQPFETPVGLVLPPPARLGAGKVYHVAENRDMEMTFGVPRMRRTIRWYTAFNEFMAARVDMMQAAAAFIMKKTVKGASTSAQIEKLASKAMRASSDLRSVADTAIDPAVKLGPRPAAIAGSTENLELEPFRLDSGAGNAQTDGLMLRAQVSAGDRFPQHYLGDQGSANLATATSMELPVLKHIDAAQELAEGVFRWGIDRAISRAVEVGNLNPEEEGEPTEVRPPELLGPEVGGELEQPVTEQMAMYHWRVNGHYELRETKVQLFEDGRFEFVLAEQVEDKPGQEEQTGLNMDYELVIPSPLRRLMGDIVGACAQLAQMADPNGENVELTRTLLTYAFQEALEMPDAADAVDRIFPKGYQPLSVTAMKQQMLQSAATSPVGESPPGQPPSQNGRNFFGPEAEGEVSDPTIAHQYGTKTGGTRPEQMPITEAAEDEEWETPPLTMIGRYGQPVVIPGKRRSGSRGPFTMPGRGVQVSREFDREARAVTMDALAELDMNRLVPKDDDGK